MVCACLCVCVCVFETSRGVTVPTELCGQQRLNSGIVQESCLCLLNHFVSKLNMCVCVRGGGCAVEGGKERCV